MKKEVFSFFLFLLIACAYSQGMRATNVGSADELAVIAAQSASTTFEGETFVLTADIDLEGQDWTPIGTAAYPFKGTFSGQGHVIKGLHSFNGTDGVGLFGYIATDGIVEDLGISEGAIVAKRSRRVGAIAGVCDGTIRKCWSMAFIPAAGNVVGGLVGELTSNGKIEDCYHTGLILNASDTIGGIAGRCSGKMTRVYNAGYAKKGNAVVGCNANGIYTDVYYDRKLYYQPSGVANNDIVAFDVTEDMFSLFAGDANWSQADNRYPVLTQFAATNAAKLSAAPMFIEAASVSPVNHANDLTNNFTLSVEGGITWACQDVSDQQWIQISGANVTVVRPCTEQDILVDSKLGAETRVVYMSPRPVENLLAGTLISHDSETGKEGVVMGYCFESYAPLNEDSRISLASQGWIGDGNYHYMVELDTVDIAADDTTFLKTLLVDGTPEEYMAWWTTYELPTTVPGHYLIRSWVHDNGCVTGWVENKKGFEFEVYGQFVPGEIYTKVDTILLEEIPTMVNALSKSPSYGGYGPVYYQWLVNMDTIPSQTGLNLVDYPIYVPGEYKFNRGTRDSVCYVPTKSLDELGYYIVEAFPKFDPGEIIDPDELVFCSLEEAEQYVVKATAASGGISSTGYHYQWYLLDGAVQTGISGATSKDLSLSGLGLTPGYDYTFVREAEDNSRFTTLTLSRYSMKIHIMAELNPGAIETTVLPNFCFEANAFSTAKAHISIVDKEAATCQDGVQYRWIRNPGNKTVGTDRDLDYTFQLSDITLGVTYTYTREVSIPNSDCPAKMSEGSVQQTYGRKTYQEITTVVCASDLPYTMKLEDGTELYFRTADDTKLVKDESGDCPDETLYKLELATMPSFQLSDKVVGWCQGSGTMGVSYTDDPNIPSNTFLITFSADLAKAMGKKDTTGIITTPGYIEFTNVPYLPSDKTLYMTLQLGYQSDAAEGVCYSTPSEPLYLYPSIGGYVYSKYDRVVFVDNNPENGALADSVDNKLRFVEYQWYKNGYMQEGQTGQYYHEGGVTLYGVFYCMLKDSKGNTYRTCDITLPAETVANAPENTVVYPVPVGAGEPLSIDATGLIQIVTLAGERVADFGAVDSHIIVSAPRTQGIYFVQITTEDGVVKTHKLIVK